MTPRKTRKRKNPKRDRALKLVDQLIELTAGDDGLRPQVQALRDRLKTPMTMVLGEVPGSTVDEKCQKIGVSRQNYYAWLRGEYRPNMEQAKKLAQITGLDANDIRGRLPAA